MRINCRPRVLPKEIINRVNNIPTEVKIYSALGLDSQKPIGKLTIDEFSKVGQAATLACRQKGLPVSVKLEKPFNQQTQKEIIQEMQSTPNTPLEKFVSFIVDLASKHTQPPKNSPFLIKPPVLFFNA